MILALFLFYEMTLGRNSYWYPYLRLMPDVEFTSSWSEEELLETHDKQLNKILEDYQIEVEVEWHMFKKVLVQYPKVFKRKFIDRGLFFNIYGQVCTRCFGYGLKTTCMIPMADNMNHNSVDITIELMNYSKHLEGGKDTDYFRIAKYLNDYSALYSEIPPARPLDEVETLSVKGRFSRV